VKTTETHFLIFRGECDKWIKFFGLVDWAVMFRYENNPLSKEDAIASISYTPATRCCTFFLHQVWSVDVTDSLIKKYAFHEVAHLLLADLVSCGEARYTTETEIEEAEEKLVRRLENTIWKKK